MCKKNKHGVRHEVAEELCLKILLKQLENSRDIVSPYDESTTRFKRRTPCLFFEFVREIPHSTQYLAV